MGMTLEARRLYWATHPDYRRKQKMYQRRYLALNPVQRQKAEARSRKWYEDNPEYRSWNSMLQRCNNPKCHKYRLYGRRGIKVVYKSYKEFLADVGPKPSPKHSVDRINNNGNYVKGNCRWATAKEQANNH